MQRVRLSLREPCNVAIVGVSNGRIHGESSKSRSRKDCTRSRLSSALDNAAKTLDWYQKAFGAKEIYRSLGPDGKVMHAEVHIGDSAFYANDVMMGAGAEGLRRIAGRLLDVCRR